MADRPIIFSAPMVRALLDGRKTQTRRVLNPQPETFEVDGSECEVNAYHVHGEAVPRVAVGRCITLQKLRYAKGDRLYVRENFQLLSFGDYLPTKAQPADVRYAATEPCADLPADTRGYPWRPCIHMPRWASRLTLTVEDVRVERLQAISEADAIAEGVEPVGDGWRRYGGEGVGSVAWPDYSFRSLWESLHGPESWDANPFVVALTFRVERGNIDKAAA